jgi:hypothetical protein
LVQEELMVQGELVVHENHAMEVLEVLKPVNEMLQMLQCAQVLLREHLPPSLREEV